MAVPYDLKNEEDVKEYLHNLHIEYKFGCYSERNPEVCHLLGDYKEAIIQDFVKAASLYKSNCDERNFPRSCFKYGNYAATGKGCKFNIEEAYQYFQKACDLNDNSGCLHGGILAITKPLKGDQVAQVNKGLAMLKKSCHEYNEDKACYILSGMYLKGIKDRLEKNIKEAYVLSLKSCELGNPNACTNVAIMHQRGEGVQQNSELAKTFKARADKLKYELKHSASIKFQQGIN